MKHSKEITTLVFSALLMSACSGKLDYIEPTTARSDNVLTVDAPINKVWNSALHKLSGRFFMINSLDKNSGLMNISYSGDPENYIDCGRIVSSVGNIKGKTVYDFQASKAEQRFAVMQTIYPYDVHRTMWLDGHVNLIFEELGPGKTRITAKTRYVLTRKVAVQAIFGGPLTETDAISFNLDNGAAFPAGSDGRATKCISTGKLESEILLAVK